MTDAGLEGTARGDDAHGAVQVCSPAGVALRKPLAVLDLETTGTSIQGDRIVEIAVLKLFPDGSRDLRCRRVNPERPIPPEATQVHGISDAEVVDKPSFRAIARALFGFLSDCDFGGYNVARFDLPLLREEFRRAGYQFSWHGRAVVDAMLIYHAKERRDLVAAVRFYCGREHPKPHSSQDDVLATLEVLRAQLDRYPDLPRDVDKLHQVCQPRQPHWIDPEGKLIWLNNAVCIGFGKQHHGTPLAQLARQDRGFLDWMLRADFSDEVKQLVRAALAGQPIEAGPA
jgi:DNA polymerase-3 subunit epsilon